MPSFSFLGDLQRGPEPPLCRPGLDKALVCAGGEGPWSEPGVHPGTSALVLEEGPWTPSWPGLGGRPLGLASPSSPPLLHSPCPAPSWFGCLGSRAGVRSGRSASQLATNMLPRPQASGSGPAWNSGSSLRGRLLRAPSRCLKKQNLFPFLNVSL